MSKHSARRYATHYLKNYGQNGRFTVSGMSTDRLQALVHEFTMLGQFVVWSDCGTRFDVIVIPEGVSLR